MEQQLRRQFPDASVKPRESGRRENRLRGRSKGSCGGCRAALPQRSVGIPAGLLSRLRRQLNCITIDPPHAKDTPVADAPRFDAGNSASLSAWNGLKAANHISGFSMFQQARPEKGQEELMSKARMNDSFEGLT